jgi:hypothetical protein
MISPDSITMSKRQINLYVENGFVVVISIRTKGEVSVRERISPVIFAEYMKTINENWVIHVKADKVPIPMVNCANTVIALWNTTFITDGHIGSNYVFRNKIMPIRGGVPIDVFEMDIKTDSKMPYKCHWNIPIRLFTIDALKYKLHLDATGVVILNTETACEVTFCGNPRVIKNMTKLELNFAEIKRRFNRSRIVTIDPVNRDIFSVKRVLGMQYGQGDIAKIISTLRLIKSVESVVVLES